MASDFVTVDLGANDVVTLDWYVSNGVMTTVQNTEVYGLSGAFLLPSGVVITPSADIEDLMDLVPALEGHRLKCPRKRGCDKRGQTNHLWQVIAHLNDKHRWTRERIADWLDTLEVDLTFAATSKGD